MAILFDGKSQADNRRYVRFKDQHGRKHGVNVELKTNSPTGHWNFHPAPIQPPAHCLVISNDPDDPYKVFIDYDRIIRECREALDEYNVAKGKRLRAHPNISAIDLEREIGKEPPAVEPWIAAKQGDLWTLGLTDRVNLKVAAFLDLQKRKSEDDYDFTAEENYLDLEEQLDPKATGGTRVPVSRNKKKPEPLEPAA